MSEQRHATLGLHTEHGPKQAHTVRRTRTLRRVKALTMVMLVLLLAGAAATALVRHAESEALAADTNTRNRQYVVTVRAKAEANAGGLSLPGTLQGYIEAPIASRISGYLVRWTKDIGSRVGKGELLAEISSPETDQQLAQAIAARQQTASARDLARVSLERWKNLLAKDAVSRQEFDEKQSTFQQAEANLAAADANIRRLKELESFKRIVAPFAGIITRRNVNIGDLVDAGGSGGVSRALFLLAQPDPLRVYVYVPQAYVQYVKEGDNVSITQAELPGQAFEGKIVRTAGAIDIASRTMQAEISLPNRDGKLLPGAYVTVSMATGPSGILTVPTNVLLLRAEGPRIAVVDRTGHVQLRRVTIGKDFGLSVEILDGITGTDDLVLNPSDSLSDGDPVVVTKPQRGNAL